MIRWIVALSAALTLSGCVTTREYVYTDGSYRQGTTQRIYSDDGYSDGSYAEGSSYSDGSYAEGTYSDGSYAEGSQPRYVSSGSYYSPSNAGSGDYYYSSPSYSSGSSWYYDYPAYYSIFQPINSWWYDPYYYPSYYYGVTFYPRNYFSVSFGYPYGYGGRGYGWPRTSLFYSGYYSPYRYGWVDNYYDWEPWYSRYPSYRNHYPTPRYGSSRREAERLSSWNEPRRGGSRGQGDNRFDGRNGPAYNPRTASYSASNSRRADIGTRGFGVPTDNVRRTALDSRNATRGTAGRDDVRNVQYGDSNGTRRQLPSRGFGVPNGATPSRAGSDAGGGYVRGAEDVRRVGSTRNGMPGRADTLQTTPRGQAMPRGYGVPSRDAGTERQAADMRGYDLPSRGASRPVTRSRPDSYARDVEPMREAQIERGGSRGYATPQRGYAPQPQRDSAYSVPMERGNAAPRGAMPQRSYEPRGNSAPQMAAPARGYSAPAPREAPQYSAPPPAPRESYSAPSRSDDGGSRGSSRGDGGGRSEGGGVRRVGSNRDER